MFGYLNATMFGYGYMHLFLFYIVTFTLHALDTDLTFCVKYEVVRPIRPGCRPD